MSSSRGSDFNSKDLKMMMDLIDDNLKNGYVLSSSSKRVSKPPVRYSDISESFTKGSCNQYTKGKFKPDSYDRGYNG